jgi:Lrp/AsnC family leucine-responsive transcriptional regulator
MAYKLDLKDRKLLYELETDCRQSFSEIGKKIKLSKNSVAYRIANLEKEGILKYFRTVVDAGKLGYMTLNLYINLQNTTPKIEEEIIDFLKKKEIVTWLVSIDGYYNIGATLQAKSIKEVNELWAEMTKKYINYFSDRLMTITVKTSYYSKTYLINAKQSKNEIFLVTEPEEAELDNTDLELLKIIAANARIPIIELASRLNVSPKTAISRIKNLEEKKVIVGYKAEIDHVKLGYQYYKADFILNNTSTKDLADLKDYIRFHPNIVYNHEVLGGDDIEIEIHVENVEKLREIIEDIKSKFGKIIMDYSTMHLYKEHKSLFLPVRL